MFCIHHFDVKSFIHSLNVDHFGPDEMFSSKFKDKKQKTASRLTEKYLDNFIVYQNTVLQTHLKPFYLGQDLFFCSERQIMDKAS